MCKSLHAFEHFRERGGLWNVQVEADVFNAHSAKREQRLQYLFRTELSDQIRSIPAQCRFYRL